MTMTNRGMWRTASSGTTYPRGSFDDHIDLVSGGPVDHDGSGFVDNNSGMQERQEQYLQETRNASICNGSPPYTDAVSVYEGVGYGDGVHDAGMSNSPSSGFIGQAGSYSNGENDSMNMEDGAYLFSLGQLNDQSLRGLSFEAPQDDVDEVVSASPPSTTDTTLNNHGSAGSPASPSDQSADDNREDRRVARHAIRRATARYAGEDRRRCHRLHGGVRGHDENAETGNETENLAMVEFGASPGWLEDYWAPVPGVTLEGHEISLSSYPTSLPEDIEDLVD